MAGCLSVTTLILGTIGFVLLCVSCGTRRWKEDIDFYKGTHVYIGLWQACIESEGDKLVGYPVKEVECDKDYLRPYLNEPPAWFNSCRALMLLSVFGSGFGIFFYLVAFITDNSKKTGSKYFPSALIMFIGGLCALIALCIFTVNRAASVEFTYGANEFFAQYWTEIGEVAMVNGQQYKIETWLRWSYIVGWFGFAFTLFALITAVLSDLTRRVY